jgi:lipopolysaccharide transport system permease protein
MAKHRELLIALIRRDIQARYAQSIVGVFWALVQPLVLMFVFSLVFGRLLKTDTGGIPYPLFVYACLLPWAFFSSAMGRGTASIEVEGNVIKKVPVARIMFPLAAVLSSFVDFLAAAVVFIGMLWYYHVALNPWMLMVVPLVGLQIILTVGLSFFLSSLNAYARDVKYVVPLLLQVWFYASPIVYAMTAVPDRYRWFYDLNPMTGLMDGYRNVLVKGIAPDWELLGIAVVVTVLVMAIGYATFAKLEGNLADVL